MDASDPGLEQHDRCLTCADEGREMLVLRADAGRGLAICADATGARSTVETSLVAPVGEGDALLVHAGTAIARLPAGGQMSGGSG